MFIATENGRARVPDFLIVGAAKAGTTSLYYALMKHQRVFMPELKEPYFFSYRKRDPAHVAASASHFGVRYVTSLTEYDELFASAGAEQLVGEASTQYLYDHESVISSVQELYGGRARDLRIIIVLRDPIDRAWSNYVMHQRDGFESLPFEDATDPKTIRQRLESGWPDSYDYLGFGRYYRQVRDYKQAFDHVEVLFQDELSNGNETMGRIWRLLGLEPIEVDTSTRLNASGTPKNRAAAVAASFLYKPNRFKAIIKPLIPYTVRYKLRVTAAAKLFKREGVSRVNRDRLLPLFAEDIRNLEALLGKDLSKWRS